MVRCRPGQRDLGCNQADRRHAMRQRFCSVAAVILPVCFLFLELTQAGALDRPGLQQIANQNCPQDAKLCPDGSFVTRAGPQCRFLPCPSVHPEPPPVGRPAGGGRVCAQDARMCPDGSFVSRTGPNCEFAPCPEDPMGRGAAPPGLPGTGATICSQDARICPDGTTVTRTGPNCRFARCP